MRRLSLLLVLLLLLTTPVFADDLRVEPAVAQSNAPVTIHTAVTWPYQCGPLSTTVERVGNTIVVTHVPNPACAQVITPLVNVRYEQSVTAGPFEPGVYEVRAQIIFGGDAVQLLPETETLIVRDAEAPFVVEPEVTRPGVIRSIRIRWKTTDILLCPTPICEPVTVRIGDARSEEVTVVNPTTIVASLSTSLSQTPGTYDVTVIHERKSYRARAAFTILGEGSSALFERLLVPVMFSGPGAYNAQWSTDLWIYNGNPYHVSFANSPSPISGCTLSSPCLPFVSGDTVRAGSSFFGTRPHGIFLFLPRGNAANMRFTLLVRDLSREAEALGTEVPVVREDDFFRGPFSLLGVPLDDRFRVALRVYASEPAEVRLRIVGTGVVVEDRLPLTRAGAALQDPPAIVIGDLVARYPRLAGAGPLRIELDGGSTPLAPAVWGFVTVTNNTTQHVTVITPQ